jgi:hypothetical protein
MTSKVERDFVAHGLRCIVLAVPMGHRCGYVGVPQGHPLHGLAYGDGSPVLKAAWEKAKEGPIGKRGILSVLLAPCEGDLPKVDSVFDVHGSITYSGGDNKYPVVSDGLWWFGFDCAHCDDGKDESLMSEEYLAIHHRYPSWDRGEVRTEEYVAVECIRLAEQLAAFSTEATA